MKRYRNFIFSFFIIFLCIGNEAYGNIAPLKTNIDGVEPIEDPGLIIESANITVTPADNKFRFDCNYVFKGTKDAENLLLGVPGDLGYTLEAGYIEDFKVMVNSSPVECSVQNTTKELSEPWKKFNLPLNYKWYTFNVPVQEGSLVYVNLSYNLSWRMYNQDQSRPYNIVPFMMSTDKLFGGFTGSYKIKYISDDKISIPDIKVMINSVLESNIISKSILNPSWNGSEIEWEFNSSQDFQDFRLIALSFRKLAMEFCTGTTIDYTIRLAVSNNDYQKLASIFEDIASGNMNIKLSDEQLETAAYLSSEFYSRIGDYDKALDVLNFSKSNTIWLVPLKASYLQAMKLKESHDYIGMLEEYKKLSQYKDYILASSMAEDKINPLTEIVQSITETKNKEEELKEKEQRQHTDTILRYLNISLTIMSISILALIILLYRNIKSKS